MHEFHSPPRVNCWANLLGNSQACHLIFTTVDPDDGQPWDFNDPAKALKAEEIIKTRIALLLIGSRMCAAFSQLQSLNFSNMMTREEVDKVVGYGTRHLE